MAKEFRFPDVGEGITEGEIVRWLVKEGDEVQIDQALAEIETDKAIVEMPSPYAGTVLKLHFKEKDLVKVGQPLVTIGAKGEILAAGTPAPAPLPARPGAASAPGLPGIIPAPGRPGEVLATPGVRALAKGLGVDLAAVHGTGPGGRITEDDVRAFQAAPAEKKVAIKVKAKFDLYGSLERIPLRGIRRATAKKMRESLDHAAHVTHCDEAD
ncbi:MAG: biotin/lipoyl-containing protein, partial [Candidatus Aminicenantales bacterium]